MLTPRAGVEEYRLAHRRAGSQPGSRAAGSSTSGSGLPPVYVGDHPCPDQPGIRRCDGERPAQPGVQRAGWVASMAAVPGRSPLSEPAAIVGLITRSPAASSAPTRAVRSVHRRVGLRRTARPGRAPGTRAARPGCAAGPVGRCRGPTARCSRTGSAARCGGRGSLRRRGHHGEHGHQRDADGQRGGGGRDPVRVAPHVSAGQPGWHAEQPTGQPAEERGDRRCDERPQGEHGDEEHTAARRDHQEPGAAVDMLHTSERQRQPGRPGQTPRPRRAASRCAGSAAARPARPGRPPGRPGSRTGRAAARRRG